MTFPQSGFWWILDMLFYKKIRFFDTKITSIPISSGSKPSTARLILAPVKTLHVKLCSLESNAAARKLCLNLCKPKLTISWPEWRKRPPKCQTRMCRMLLNQMSRHRMLLNQMSGVLVVEELLPSAMAGEH